MKGILFGWEEARGNKNTYRPEAAERAGSLFFATGGENSDEDGSAPATDELQLHRARNVDGLQGDTQLVSDIDKETFRTMFALNSDELRSLRNTSNMTARLLTAGSGTGASPAEALRKIDAQIATFSSRAESADNSLVRISDKLADLRDEMTALSEENDRIKAEDREYHELARLRDDIARRIRALNHTIETHTAWKARLEKLDEQRADLDEQRAQLAREMTAAALQDAEEPADVPDSIVNLDAATERAYRDELDHMAQEQVKFQHSIDAARENQRASKASYEALLEVQPQLAKTRHKLLRPSQAGLAAVLAIVFVVVGVLLFVRGRAVTSLSYTALGAGLVLFALILAITAVVLMARPDKAGDSLAQRMQDMQWVMLQDKKKLEAVEQTSADHDARIAQRLEEMGLGGAGGQVTAARAMLDVAKDVRAARKLAAQRTTALNMRSARLQDAYDDIDLQKSRLAAESGLHDDLSADRLDELIAQNTRQRDSLIEASAKTNARFGELSQALAQARGQRTFDQVKLEYQEYRTRMRDSRKQLIELLLARNMLEGAINSWESRSQPEVYATASRLLSLMTEGKWVQVGMSTEGRVEVTDATHVVREPRLLSMGTCQQLYLALRIALLMNADNVGSAIPVLADDILVNFDDERRRGAARALLELSRTRQVVLLTCHREIVECIEQADSTVAVIEL